MRDYASTDYNIFYVQKYDYLLFANNHVSKVTSNQKYNYLHSYEQKVIRFQ